MNWSDIKDAVGGAAPLVGLALGGPAGGAVGTLVAKALGVEGTPAAVAQAIQTGPEAALKLRTLELNHEAELECLAMQQAANELAADTARIESVNATMRVEAQSEKWYVAGWRPFWGFVSAITFFLAVMAIFALAFVALWTGNEGMWALIPELVESLINIFWVAGVILGVASWHRGREKRIRAGERGGGLTGAFTTMAGGGLAKVFGKGGR